MQRKRGKPSIRSRRNGIQRDRDPFACLRNEDHFEVRRDALQSWYAASWKRWSMVAERDPAFFEVSAIAMDGYVCSCESAFIAWAKIEVDRGANCPAMQELSTADELDSGFDREQTVNWAFGEFLHWANIRLPDAVIVLTNYLLVTARRTAANECDAMDGAATLCKINQAIARAFPLHLALANHAGLRARPVPACAADCFKLLANGIMPGSFDPPGRAPEIEHRIRRESAHLVEQNAALEITSDEPTDWPTRWRPR